jgi:tRNA pseudouridine55 synthase
MILPKPETNNTDWHTLRGIIPLYKPRGISSHTAVAIVRRLTGEQRVGHGGTLDPLAEGVLVLGIGRDATKQLEVHAKGEKTYRTTIRLGYTSETLDAEGPVTQTHAKHVPSHKEVDHALCSFLGETMQTPPAYSALKIQGKPAYTLARKGKEVTLAPRRIHISRISCNAYTYPDIEATIVCSGGTYIRAIARDVGEKLGTGAYMYALTRTAVAIYTQDTCYRLPPETYQKNTNRFIK